MSSLHQDNGAVVAWGNPDFGGDASAASHLMRHSIVDTRRQQSFTQTIRPPTVPIVLWKVGLSDLGLAVREEVSSL